MIMQHKNLVLIKKTKVHGKVDADDDDLILQNLLLKHLCHKNMFSIFPVP